LRFDSEYLYKTVNSLEKHETYLTNNTLYEIFDEYKFLQCYTGIIGRDYRLITIEKDESIGSIARFCKHKRTAEEIINFIQTENDVTQEEAEEFFHELRNEQILNPSQSYSGSETQHIINFLDKNIENSEFHELKKYIDICNTEKSC
jgi:predicted transcriptional regulator